MFVFLGCNDSRCDVINQRGKAPLEFFLIEHRCEGPASGVTHDRHQRRMQMVYLVSDATYFVDISHIVSDTNHECISNSLIKQQLHRNPGIGFLEKDTDSSH